MVDAYVWLAGYWLLTRELLLLAAAGVAVSSLDDLLFDILYFARELWRRLTVYRVWARADASSLAGPEAGAPIAVFVLWMGVAPNVFIDPVRAPVAAIVARLEPTAPHQQTVAVVKQAAAKPQTSAETH